MVCRCFRCSLVQVTNVLHLFYHSADLSDFQFHPESVATCHGRQIFKNFRQITEDYWLRSSSSFFRKRYAHFTGNGNLFVIPVHILLFSLGCWGKVCPRLPFFLPCVLSLPLFRRKIHVAIVQKKDSSFLSQLFLSVIGDNLLLSFWLTLIYF